MWQRWLGFERVREVVRVTERVRSRRVREVVRVTEGVRSERVIKARRERECVRDKWALLDRIKLIDRQVRRLPDK